MKLTVANGSKSLVVGDDNRGQLPRYVDLLEKAMNGLTGFAVEITGRFVSQQEPRLGDERSRQRYSRLFAAGQLAGPVRNAISETNACEHRFCSLSRSSKRAAPNQQRHHRVFNCGELGQQVMKLKDESNLPVPKPRQVYITEFEDVKLTYFYRPCSRTV